MPTHADIEAAHDRVRAIHGPVPRAELLAQAIADDPIALRARFGITLDCVIPDLRSRFRQARLDVEAKALIGDGAVLRYQLRRYPDQAISYRNQQTSLGIVTVEKEA